MRLQLTQHIGVYCYAIFSAIDSTVDRHIWLSNSIKSTMVKYLHGLCLFYAIAGDAIRKKLNFYNKI